MKLLPMGKKSFLYLTIYGSVVSFVYPWHFAIIVYYNISTPAEYFSLILDICSFLSQYLVRCWLLHCTLLLHIGCFYSGKLRLEWGDAQPCKYFIHVLTIDLLTEELVNSECIIMEVLLSLRRTCVWIPNYRYLQWYWHNPSNVLYLSFCLSFCMLWYYLLAICWLSKYCFSLGFVRPFVCYGIICQQYATFSNIYSVRNRAHYLVVSSKILIYHYFG